MNQVPSTPGTGSERQGEVVDDPSVQKQQSDPDMTQAQEGCVTSSDQNIQVAALP